VATSFAEASIFAEGYDGTRRRVKKAMDGQEKLKAENGSVFVEATT
jgi:hypothetical protein